MFRFADIARVVSTLRPHKYAYVFLKYALKMLIIYACCYAFVNGCSPSPTLPWQGDDLFFLFSLFRLKKSSFLGEAFFFFFFGGGGGGGGGVSSKC